MIDQPAPAQPRPGPPAETARTLDLADPRCQPTARHLVRSLAGETLQADLLVSADGGGSGVHDRSLLVLDDRCYCAVGPWVVALALPGLEPLWTVQVDPSCCLGLHLLGGLAPTAEAALVAHGELQVSRLTLGGELSWQQSGADIFTGPFTVAADYILAEDFGGRRYRFDLATGDVTDEPRSTPANDGNPAPPATRRSAARCARGSEDRASEE